MAGWIGLIPRFLDSMLGQQGKQWAGHTCPKVSELQLCGPTSFPLKVHGRCIEGLLLEGAGLLSVAAAPGRWLSRSGEHTLLLPLSWERLPQCTAPSIHQSVGHFMSYSAGGSATLLSPASITTLQPSGWMLGNVSWAPGMWRCRS